MKKILSIFATVSLLAVLILPAVSLAQIPPSGTIPEKCVMANDIADCPDPGQPSYASDANGGTCCLLNTIYTVTNWIFYIITLIAVLMIIYGGFVYITAAGDPAKATTAKSILTFAIIGLAIALLAKLIPSLVRFILGV
ncbi:MAG: pilin [bacterium]|nr:pilin [bacterium]